MLTEVLPELGFGVPDKRYWSLHPLSLLNWRDLDGEWVVYDAGSGNTHHLPPLPAGVLMCIEAQPQQDAALLQSMHELFVQESRTELEQALTQSLAQLAALDLIVARL